LAPQAHGSRAGQRPAGCQTRPCSSSSPQSCQQRPGKVQQLAVRLVVAECLMAPQCLRQHTPHLACPCPCPCPCPSSSRSHSHSSSQRQLAARLLAAAAAAAARARAQVLLLQHLLLAQELALPVGVWEALGCPPPPRCRCCRVQRGCCPTRLPPAA
jgi:hypothetical protein